MAIQAAIRRKQKAASFNRPQHGRRRLLKSIDQFKEKEKNFVNHTLHLYSAKLIAVCKRYNVGTLILRRISESTDQDEAVTGELHRKLILRNWSYFLAHE